MIIYEFVGGLVIAIVIALGVVKILEWLGRISLAKEENDIKVTPSCGCIFCDLDLEPELVNGVWLHRTAGHPDNACAVRTKR